VRKEKTPQTGAGFEQSTTFDRHHHSTPRTALPMNGRSFLR